MAMNESPHSGDDLIGRKRFDDVIRDLGGFGRYQRIFVLFYTIPKIICGMMAMAFFLAYVVPDHRCVLPEFPNDTYRVGDETHKMAVDTYIPSGHFRKCYVNDLRVNFSHAHYNSSSFMTSYGSVEVTSLENITQHKCDEWVYDVSEYDHTVVTDFNFVCDDKLVPSHAKMLFFVGFLIGSVVLGMISDAFGRRVAFRCGLFTMATSSLTISLSNNRYLSLAILPFAGAGLMGLNITCFVAAMELLLPDKRVKPGILYLTLYGLGLILTLPVSYLTRNWWSPFLVTSIISTIYLILSLWLPESARWLLSKGHVKRAEEELRRMARYNGVTVSSDFNLEHVVLEKEERQVWRHVIKSRKLLCDAVIICINWFTVGMVYYGLTINAVNMVGNRFLNNFLASFMDIIGVSTMYFLLDRFGRTRIHCICMIAGGLSILVTMFVVFFAGTNMFAVMLLFSFIGRMALGSAFIVAYFMSAEIFPTNVRTVVMGASSACARVGSILAPYLADLAVNIDATYGQALPLAVFGTAAVTAGLLALKLPKTAKERLPDTVHQGEMLGKCENM